MLKDQPDLINQTVQTVMTPDPISIHKNVWRQSFRVMQEHEIDELTADDLNRLVGIIDIQDLLKIGLL